MSNEEYRPDSWLPPLPNDRPGPPEVTGSPRVPYPLADLPTDAPDPWDRIPLGTPDGDDESTITELLPIVEEQPTRSGRPGVRILLTTLVVMLLLLGSGALARNLTSRSAALPPPSPPPAPAPTSTSTSTDITVEGQLGTAPAAPSPSTMTATASTPTPPSTTSAPTPTVTVLQLEYEAEQADLRGSAESYQVEVASAGYAVRGLGSGLLFSGEVRFSVEVEKAGEYELTLYYLADRTSPGRVRVNGDPVEVEFPGLSGADEVAAVSLTVPLREGHNEIRFGSPTRHAPALDRITITQL